ncbi:MAG: biotin/lipoyl-containing protein, partial [Gammaproteobacteria bacterium]|nr:biotin/lipoyl-containing protein [Gammaproteobacteria bacterium]
HQKVIEEAPSPFLDEKTREAMGEQAITLAKAVDYKSAGTVEFIVDTKRNFYFLEMNTRLQVEHPVTELITGQDLVEWMIRIAAGEKLTLKQKDVNLNGWAVETRVYAEDPFRNFMPSIGRLVRYHAPEESDSVRVDTGIEEGSEVSMYYDPMIAKLISYGADRLEALERMGEALDSYYIRGVSHNIGFLNALIAHPRLIEGKLTTNFIAEEYPDGFHAADVPQDEPALATVMAAAIHRQLMERAALSMGQLNRAGIRIIEQDRVAVVNGENHPVTTSTTMGGYDVVLDGTTYHVLMDWTIGEPIVRASINDRAVIFQLDSNGAGFRLFRRGAQIDVLVCSPRGAELNQHMLEKIPPDLSRFLLSPMPGLLVKLSVSAGDEVKAGEELAVVEAMKMENSLRATDDVRVARVLAEQGDSLIVDQPILEFE